MNYPGNIFFLCLYGFFLFGSLNALVLLYINSFITAQQEYQEIIPYHFKKFVISVTKGTKNVHYLEGDAIWKDC